MADEKSGLAAYWTLVSDSPATQQEADHYIALFVDTQQLEDRTQPDEQSCLEAIMTKVLPFQYVDGRNLVTEQMPIADAILMVCENPIANAHIVTRLAQLGLRISRNKVTNAFQLMVVNSAAHQELRKIFAGTPWASGWGTVLRRLPGGHESTQRIGSGLGVAKVTVFDLPLEPDVEVPFRLAA